MQDVYCLWLGLDHFGLDPGESRRQKEPVPETVSQYKSRPMLTNKYNVRYNSVVG
jgi:hypothetical protein